LNLQNQILIWNHQSASSSSILINSWWILIAPHPLIKKYLIINLCFSLFRYHPWRIPWTSWVEKRLSDSMILFTKICYRSLASRIVDCVIPSGIQMKMGLYGDRRERGLFYRRHAKR
jgi:hypothetical protein